MPSRRHEGAQGRRPGSAAPVTSQELDTEGPQDHCWLEPRSSSGARPWPGARPRWTPSTPHEATSTTSSSIGVRTFSGRLIASNPLRTYLRGTGGQRARPRQAAGAAVQDPLRRPVRSGRAATSRTPYKGVRAGARALRTSLLHAQLGVRTVSLAPIARRASVTAVGGPAQEWADPDRTARTTRACSRMVSVPSAPG